VDIPPGEPILGQGADTHDLTPQLQQIPRQLHPPGRGVRLQCIPQVAQHGHSHQRSHLRAQIAECAHRILNPDALLD